MYVFSSHINAVYLSRKGGLVMYDIPEEALGVILNDISISWNVDPLLASGRGTSSCTAVIAE
jgi:hypothetical protein